MKISLDIRPTKLTACEERTYMAKALECKFGTQDVTISPVYNPSTGDGRLYYWYDGVTKSVYPSTDCRVVDAPGLPSKTFYNGGEVKVREVDGNEVKGK